MDKQYMRGKFLLETKRGCMSLSLIMSIRVVKTTTSDYKKDSERKVIKTSCISTYSSHLNANQHPSARQTHKYSLWSPPITPCYFMTFRCFFSLVLNAFHQSISIISLRCGFFFLPVNMSIIAWNCLFFFLLWKYFVSLSLFRHRMHLKWMVYL